MNTVSIFLGLIIAMLFVLAIRRIIRHGACEECSKHCGASGGCCHCQKGTDQSPAQTEKTEERQSK